MHASSADEPGPPDILKQIGCMVLESRIPSNEDGNRGYIEGPHYPSLSLGAPEGRPLHHCSPQENKQCRLVQQLEEIVYKAARPYCVLEINIHVYLTPLCNSLNCNGQRERNDWMMIESWNFKTFPIGSEKPFAITSLTLIHAIRSFLHFTQLSCWLNRSKGKWNHEIEMAISPNGPQWLPDHAENLIVHKFADCRIGDTVLSICANLLPKLDKIPTVVCRECTVFDCTPPTSPVTVLRPRATMMNYRLTSLQSESQRFHEQYIGTPFRPRSFYLEHIRHSLDGGWTSEVQPTFECINTSPVEDGILIKPPPNFSPVQTARDRSAEPPNGPSVQTAFERRHNASDPIPIPGINPLRSEVDRLNERNRIASNCLIEDFVKNRKSPEKESGSEEVSDDPQIEQNRGRDRTPRKRQASERSGNSRDRRLRAENVVRVAPQRTSRKLDLESDESSNVFTLMRNREVPPRPDLSEPGPSRTDCLGTNCETSLLSTKAQDEPVHVPANREPKKVEIVVDAPQREDEMEVSGTNCPGHCDKFRTTYRTVPSAQDRDKFHRYLCSSASMVFHTRNGLPLTSSPAPLSRGPSFDFDNSINYPEAVEELPAPLSPVDMTTSPVPYEAFKGKIRKDLRREWRPSFSSTSLLGSFEESMLNGRLEPTATVEGFRADLGASGSFCPPHREMPVSVFFYTLTNELEGSSPYLGHINLGKKGYHVPKEGTIQLTLFNPQGTVIKMFVVLYNLKEMPPNSRTFLRQRTYYMPASAGEHHPDVNKWLRYLIHLRFASTKSGRIVLHTDIRLIVIRKSDADTAFGHELEKRYEWKSFTRGPTNPRFSPSL